MKSEAVLRDPLPIVREYLAFSDPRVRGNACAALAAIASQDSLADLLELAMKDPDAAVRARAAQEIAQLDSESQARCLDLAADALGDPARQREVAGLLARLREAGVPIRLPGLALADRLRLAVAPGRGGSAWGKTSFWRALGAAALGAFIGVVLLLVGLELLDFADRKVQVFLVLTSVAAAALLGPLALRFSKPLRTYLEGGLGSLVEIAAVFVGTLLPLLVLVLFYLFFWAMEEEKALLEKFGLALLVILCGAVFSAAVRGGTLIGAMATTSRRWRRPVQAAVGTALGTLVLTGLSQGLIRLTAPDDLAGAELTAGWWLLLLPVGFGLAAALSSLDDGPHSRRGARWLAMAASLLLVLALIPLWLWLIPHDPERSRPVLEQLAKSKSMEWGPYDRTPVAKDFRVSFPQKVKVQAPKDPSFENDIYLRVWKGSKTIGDADDPEDITLELKDPGVYRVEVTEYLEADFIDGAADGPRAESLRSSFFAVATRLAQIDLGQADTVDTGFRIKVFLNEDPTFAFLVQVSELLKKGDVRTSLQAFDHAAALDRTRAESFTVLDQICRLGSLQGEAKLVLPKCERAVEAAPIPYVLDSRGIARALAGRLDDAAADFESVSRGARDKKFREQRTQWADRLRKGENPLSSAIIEGLLQEAKTRNISRQSVPELVHLGFERLRQDQTAGALALIEQALQNSPSLAAEDGLWESACWYGVLRGDQESAAAVVRACERAEEAVYYSPQTRLGSSIASARAGDRPAALRYLAPNFLPPSHPLYEVSFGWRETLEAGGNPFTPEVLAQIQQVMPLPDLAKVEEELLKSLESGGES